MSWFLFIIKLSKKIEKLEFIKKKMFRRTLPLSHS